MVLHLLLDDIILCLAEMDPDGMYACHSLWLLPLREPLCLRTISIQRRTIAQRMWVPLPRIKLI